MSKKSLDFKEIAAKMTRREIKAPSGRKVLDCGDLIAAALAGKTEKEIVETLNRVCQIAIVHGDDSLATFAEELEKSGLLSTRSAFRAYRRLNLGMRRMNIGNRVRGCLTRAGVNDKLTKTIFAKVAE